MQRRTSTTTAVLSATLADALIDLIKDMRTRNAWDSFVVSLDRGKKTQSKT
jgi:hypothetical protein